jgi:hypothetical protein
VQNKKKVNEMVEDGFGGYPTTEELLVELDRIGVPHRTDSLHPRGLRLGADTIAGTANRPQPQHAGTPHTARPPAALLRPDGTEVTRTDHRPPPVLGADNDTVSDWLPQGAVR